MTPPAVMSWSHVALNCTDQAATEEFYRRWFGFARVRAVPLPGAKQVIFLRNGQVLLELFEADGDPTAKARQDGPPQPGTVRHLAFQTDDVGTFLAALAGEAPISLGPLDFDEVIPGWRTVWLLDPDGVVVEVSQGYHDESHE
jgi:glyoxylase I family protein